jgi:DNA polymerase bacteriophage-type
MNHCELDFETYSEAGYELVDGIFRKLGGPPYTSKAGIGIVGATTYSEHPSTEVLSLAFDLNDGYGPQIWIPGMPPPEPLFGYVERGFPLEAWNSMFEYLIWKNVCTARMGWPAVPLSQFRDAMAKAKAYSLPGKLKDAAKAARTEIQKQTDGTRLLNKFSIPRKPTIKNPRLRLMPEEDPTDASRLYSYNFGDIAAEKAVSEICPELPPDELELWMLDQEINDRGVAIDQVGLENCRAVIAQAMTKYTAELQEITGGTVEAATKIAPMKKWLMEVHGVDMASMDKAAVADALTWHNDYLPAPARRVLEIRELIGSAAVKKLHSIAYQCAADGRLHGLFAYWGAHTGRWAGRGPQPQNLPNSGPDCRHCDPGVGCGRHYVDQGVGVCPWCGTDTNFSKDVEWCPEAVVDALEVVSHRSLATVEKYFGDAVATISGCLRGLFVAGPGHDLICSDYSAIEAVVQAMLTGEEWRIDVFKDHGKIYEMSASKITGIPFEEFMKHKKETGSHHPMRKKIGKIAELACFSKETKVLTDSGWKNIVDITLADRLHDGVEWVEHGGVVNRGNRLTTTFAGVTVTPDHKFFTGSNTWRTAEDLKGNTHYQKLAIGTARWLLNRCGNELVPRNESRLFVDVAAAMSTQLIGETCVQGNPLGVTSAQRRQPQGRKRSTINIALIPNIDADCSIDCRQPLADAIRRTTGSTPSTEDEALVSTLHGSSTKTCGCNTYAAYRDGTTRMRPLIGSIMMGGMNQEISGSSPTGSNKVTNVKLCGSNMPDIECLPRNFIDNMPLTSLMPTRSSTDSERGSPQQTSSKPQEVEVFDVIDAGPRSRFVIDSKLGPLIVHNSGYAGWIGAWKNFGADKFMDDEEIKENILKWRDASPNIVEFWGGQTKNFRPCDIYGLEGAFIMAVQNPGSAYRVRDIAYQYDSVRDVVFCRLPSGRTMKYHRPVLTPTIKFRANVFDISYEGEATRGWSRIDTYGGRLFENICQAVARDVLAYALVNLEKAGYPTVLHVHDEIIAEVPEGWGSVEEFEKIMATMPPWAADWPIRASGGWRGKRFGK